MPEARGNNQKYPLRPFLLNQTKMTLAVRVTRRAFWIAVIGAISDYEKSRLETETFLSLTNRRVERSKVYCKGLLEGTCKNVEKK